MSDKDEKTVNDFINSKLSEVARNMGKDRQEVFERMNRGDATFKAQVTNKLAKEIKATTNLEVREAAKRLKEEK